VVLLVDDVLEVVVLDAVVSEDFADFSVGGLINFLYRQQQYM
jgi:hypothetical protein